MDSRQCPILGEKKTALAGAVQEEQSVRSQRPQFHFRIPDPRLNSHQRQLMVRKAERSTSRVRGAGFGRRPLIEAAA